MRARRKALICPTSNTHYYGFILQIQSSYNININNYYLCSNHHLRRNYESITECARGKLRFFVDSIVRTIKDIESYKNEVATIEQRITELKEQKADEYDIKYQVKIWSHIDCRNK